MRCTISRRRRGMALLAVLVMIGIIHLTVINAVTRGSTESDVLALRLETVRAMFAADSGVYVWLRADAAGQTPEAGSALNVGRDAVIFVESPEAGESGSLVVEGQSGRARRRVMVDLE